MLGYLSADIICSEKRTVFRERTSKKNVSYEEQIMSKDKYPSIFSPQMTTIVFIILQIFIATRAVLKIGEYLVNKPLQAAGMSVDNVRGWEIVRKMNLWPRSQGHYQPTYQHARKRFIYFISLPLIFNSQNFKTARKHGKKASGDLMANARDWRVGVNLIGLTNFISTVIGPNLTSCHLKLILVTPLGSKTQKLGAFGSYIPADCSKTGLERNVFQS